MTETARAAIERIQADLTGELLALSIREGERDPDEEQGDFTRATAQAVWQALYELAARIDKA